MNSKFLKILVFCLTFSLLIGILPVFAEENDISEALCLRDGIIEYELKKTNSESIQDFIDGYLSENAGVSSEWFAIAINQIEQYDLSKYGALLEAYLENNEINSASTRLKMILSLIASDCGSEYIEKNLDESIGKLGIMSEIFGIHAINNGASSNLHTIKSLTDSILARQLSDGGWGINGKNSDVDTTAMAIQALAISYTEPEVATAIESGLQFLSEKQQDNGGFVMYGVNNPESVSQVIIALSDIGIDCETDTRFIKNGNTLFDALSFFELDDGSFSHIEGGESNSNATIQVLCAAIAYIRMSNNQSAFYVLDKHDFSDISQTEEKISVDSVLEASLPSENAEPEENKIGLKTKIIIGIISIAILLCIVLLICKNKNKSTYILIAVTAIVAIILVSVSGIKTVEEYYSTIEAEKENTIGTVTISIKCDELIGKSDESHIPQNGIILDSQSITICEGDTVYSILAEATAKNRIPIEINGMDDSVYVEGIGHIYEFDFGELSGWTYYVNGKIPNLGCGEYKLSAGDVIEWVYTCDIDDEYENLS